MSKLNNVFKKLLRYAPPFLLKYIRSNNKLVEDEIKYVSYNLGAVVKAEHGRGIIAAIYDPNESEMGVGRTKLYHVLIEAAAPYRQYGIYTEEDLNKYNYKNHIFQKDLKDIIND